MNAATEPSARLARAFKGATYDKLGEKLKKRASVSNKRRKEARTKAEVWRRARCNGIRSDPLKKASVKIKDEGK